VEQFISSEMEKSAFEISDDGNSNSGWKEKVGDNSRFSRTNQSLFSPGYQPLKIWSIDSGLVLRNLILNTGDLRRSYPGLPESY
jgi:hypothetical protein